MAFDTHKSGDVPDEPNLARGSRTRPRRLLALSEWTMACQPNGVDRRDPFAMTCLRTFCVLAKSAVVPNRVGEARPR